MIAWGLGNLTFSCACTEEVDGALLLVDLDCRTVEASIVPIDAGLRGRSARPATNPDLMLELFAAIGSTRIERRGLAGAF